MSHTLDILDDVMRERLRQDSLWGKQEHDDGAWSLILGEEFGEVCKAALEIQFDLKDDEPLRKELVQVAAVAVNWIEALERR